MSAARHEIAALSNLKRPRLGETEMPSIYALRGPGDLIMKPSDHSIGIGTVGRAAARCCVTPQNVRGGNRVAASGA